jgi:non-specific serine/threonine protein kinase
MAKGRLVAVGGEQPLTVDAVVDAFDLSKKSWSSLPPMPTGRHGAGVAAAGPSVYVVDGGLKPTHANPTATAEVLDL